MSSDGDKGGLQQFKPKPSPYIADSVRVCLLGLEAQSLTKFFHLTRCLRTLRARPPEVPEKAPQLIKLQSTKAVKQPHAQHA